MRDGIERVGRDIAPERAERGCFKKRVFDTRNEARDWQIRNMKRHPDNKPAHPYRCGVCGHWHLTTQPKKDSPPMDINRVPKRAQNRK